MATAKNNEANVIMLLAKKNCFTFVEHAPYWGLLFVLFFAVLCKTSKAKKYIYKVLTDGNIANNYKSLLASFFCSAHSVI